MRKRNGWQRPWTKRQVGFVLYVVGSAAAFFAFLRKSLRPRELQLAVVIIQAVTLLVLLVSGAAITGRDPADPGVKDADFRGHPPDDLKHCTICRVDVHRTSMHCRHFIVSVAAALAYSSICCGTSVLSAVRILRGGGDALAVEEDRAAIASLVIALAAASAFLAVFTGHLVLFHLRLAQVGMTTIEFAHALREKDELRGNARDARLATGGARWAACARFLPKPRKVVPVNSNSAADVETTSQTGSAETPPPPPAPVPSRPYA